MIHLRSMHHSSPSLLVLPLLLAFGCASAEKTIDTPTRQGQLFEGEQTGPWTYRYPSGQNMAQGEYEHDRQTGLWTYWYANGNQEWQGIFADEALDGPSASWYEDGSPRARGYFRKGDEAGPWTFWSPDDKEQQIGDFNRAGRTLRWTHFHPSGSVHAEGYYFNNRRTGLWQFWSPTGEVTEKTFPSPPGVELYLETWPDGTLRREGFLRAGKPHGRWVSWHAGGSRRMLGDFQRGMAVGQWHAWAADGSPLAVGGFNQGKAAGEWTTWKDGKLEMLDASGFDSVPATDAWSEDSLSDWFPPSEVVPTWVAEMSFAAEATEIEGAGAPAPDARTLAITGRRATVPIREQPWTISEQENIQAIVDLYSDSAPRRGGRGRYGSRAGRARRGDTERAAAMVGKPLPMTTLLHQDEQVLDLNTYKGKKNVLLVLLRGYAGYVCVYCAAQTKALRDHVAEFEDLDTEIVVVYPGNRDRLDAFLRSYSSLVDDEGVPPFTMAYDPDFELVDTLMLRADLALPSTLLLDQDGVVRYAYIGVDKVDRPNAKSLLDAIRALP